MEENGVKRLVVDLPYRYKQALEDKAVQNYMPVKQLVMRWIEQHCVEQLKESEASGKD